MEKQVYSDNATGFFTCNDSKNLSFLERRQRNLCPDANAAHTGLQCTRELMQTGNAMVNMTGNASLAYKLSRHGHKSNISLANVDPMAAGEIPPHVQTFEYSFSLAKPRMSNMPVLISLSPITYPETTNDGINTTPNRITNNPQTLLGTTFDLTGESSYTGLKLIQKKTN